MVKLRKVLDVLILVFALSILIVIATGGFRFSLLGISIKSTHIYKPLTYLLLLIFIRFFITADFKNMLLAAFTTFACLFLVETAIRVWDPPSAKPNWVQIHQPSPLYDWDLIPGATGTGGLGKKYRINAAGFREDMEYPLPKTEEAFRIMAIGDSFTFGMGVDLENTYSKQLERLLQKEDKRY